MEYSLRLEYSLRIERIKKNFFRTGFEAYGISFYDGVVLLVIGKGIIQNQDDVSLSSGIDKYRITRIMSKLESDNLITRETCATNKRKKIVKLTESGAEMCRKLHQVVEEWEKVCYTNFTEEEEKMLKSLMKKIVTNLGTIDT